MICRHSFAVNTILDAYRTDAIRPRGWRCCPPIWGTSIQPATYWYLQAAPELMASPGSDWSGTSEAGR